ncbi:hypothetical protein [Ideonella oryzae]|uniref:Uncharacterized protein n=1 Tax=Ideonella oryzae TaxID=2937441 RepID=A0ABT1BKR2_9BURK|nr:hypothetical protein [Ideonella oryzae]MCO5976795.1 hypothetical protein [Ideonella oryzae]
MMVFREDTGVHLAPDLEATLWFSPVWRWGPQCELKQADPREAPLLPIPFDGRKLAAFLLHPAISASFPDPPSAAHYLLDLLTSVEDSVCRCAVEEATALLEQAFDALGPMASTRWRDLDRSDADSTPTEQMQADRRRSEDEEIDWLNRMVREMFSGGCDKRPKGTATVIEQRGELILQTLEELGHNPLELPPYGPGKGGAKQAAWERLRSSPKWKRLLGDVQAERKAFEKAWGNLLAGKKIKNTAS